MNLRWSALALAAWVGSASFYRARGMVVPLAFTAIWGMVGSVSAQPFTFSLLDSSQTAVSFRGLSAVSDQVVWVSGSRGTVGRSLDGGRTWAWVSPVGYSQRDFRDVEAFDGDHAVIMAVDSPGLILRTSTGGKVWETVYEDHRPAIFLDAMVFHRGIGYCVGDPLDGRFVLLGSEDSGRSWHQFPDSLRPAALPGEACFAASGSNLMVPQLNHGPMVFFVSGGTVSRLHAIGSAPEWPTALPLTMQQGGATTGANAIAFLRRSPFIVGGDFSNPSRMDSTISTADTQWYHGGEPPKSPIGYASGVAAVNDSTVVLCGLRGVALLQRPRQGNPFTSSVYSLLGFHTVQLAKTGRCLFVAGPRGRIGVLTP